MKGATRVRPRESNQGEETLTGVKVVELCESVAGSYCCKLLADLGAEVIKIENPEHGDRARRRGPFLGDLPHPERSGLFLYLNTSKLGVTLNLENPDAAGIVKTLVGEADVFIEDNPPGRLAELGLGYAALQAVNGRLIVVSITPFGQTGPYRDYKAYSLNLFHCGGEGYYTPAQAQFLDRPPLMAGKYVADYECGISSAIATLVALYWQRITGMGQYIDISKQQCLLALNLFDVDKYANEGFIVSRATRGFRLGGIMPCKDGYVQLVLYEEHQWKGLVEMMGSPDWAKDKRFEDHVSRTKHASQLNPLISRWLMNQTKEELYAQAKLFGVPIAPYHNIEEVVNSEQMKSREFFATVDHPLTGGLQCPSVPYKFSKTPARLRAAPLLGQHNEEIYCQRLGYSRQDIPKMREAGII